MEPIVRIAAVRSGVHPVLALRVLDRVEREEPGPGDERRRRPAQPPHADASEPDDDGRLHVDVQA